MKISKIIIVLGEPQSTFSEILFKYFKSKKFSKNKKKVVLIGNVNLLLKQMKKLNYKLNLNIIDKVKDAKVKNINIININYKSRETFAKISSYSSKYIAECFKKGLNLIKNNKNIALINGPISKKYFLKKNILV